MYLLKIAFRPWRRAWFGQILGGLATTFLLITGVFLFSLYQGLGGWIQQIQSKGVVTVFLNPSATAEMEETLTDSIRTQIGAAPETHSQEEFLREMKEQDPRLAEELAGLGPELKNLVPKFMTFESPQQNMDWSYLSKSPGVDSIGQSSHRFTNTVGALKAFRILCGALLIGLMLTLGVLTLQMVKMHQVFYQDFVRLVAQWGGRKWRQKMPVFLSATTTGLVASGLASLIWAGFGREIQLRIRNLSPALGELGFELGRSQWIFLFAAGVGVAFLVSVVSRARETA